jgi:hypothetical protein
MAAEIAAFLFEKVFALVSDVKRLNENRGTFGLDSSVSHGLVVVRYPYSGHLLGSWVPTWSNVYFRHFMS